MSIADTYTIAEDTRLANLVVLATIQEIDPPFFRNPANSPPPILTRDSLVSSAVLRVLVTYKGASPSAINAAILGYCFSASECTGESANYRWTDLVGYKILVFLNAPSDLYGRGSFYPPFRLLVVSPDGTQVVDVSRQNKFKASLADVTRQIQAAPLAP